MLFKGGHCLWAVSTNDQREWFKIQEGEFFSIIHYSLAVFPSDV